MTTSTMKLRRWTEFVALRPNVEGFAPEGFPKDVHCVREAGLARGKGTTNAGGLRDLDARTHGARHVLGSRNGRGLRPPDRGEDRGLRRLQPARRAGRVVERRPPASCLPNRGAMAPALLFRSAGLDLLRLPKVSVPAHLDLSAIHS